MPSLPSCVLIVAAVGFGVPQSSATVPSSDAVAKFGIAALKVAPGERTSTGEIRRADLIGSRDEKLGSYREDRTEGGEPTVTATLTWKGRTLKLIGSDRKAELWEGNKLLYTMRPLQPSDEASMQAYQSNVEFTDLIKALSDQLKQLRQQRPAPSTHHTV